MPDQIVHLIVSDDMKVASTTKAISAFSTVPRGLGTWCARPARNGCRHLLAAHGKRCVTLRRSSSSMPSFAEICSTSAVL
jgi:hypothetical protein